MLVHRALRCINLHPAEYVITHPRVEEGFDEALEPIEGCVRGERFAMLD